MEFLHRKIQKWGEQIYAILFLSAFAGMIFLYKYAVGVRNHDMGLFMAFVMGGFFATVLSLSFVFLKSGDAYKEERRRNLEGFFIGIFGMVSGALFIFLLDVIIYPTETKRHVVSGAKCAFDGGTSVMCCTHEDITACTKVDRNRLLAFHLGMVEPQLAAYTLNLSKNEQRVLYKTEFESKRVSKNSLKEFAKNKRGLFNIVEKR